MHIRGASSLPSKAKVDPPSVLPAPAASSSLGAKISAAAANATIDAIARMPVRRGRFWIRSLRNLIVPSPSLPVTLGTSGRGPWLP